MIRYWASHTLRAVVVFVVQHMAKSASTNYTDSQRLYHDLFDNYVPVRPVIDFTDVTWVDVSFSLFQIKSLDGKSQLLETSGQLIMMWNDTSLSWDPRDYGGIYYTEADASKIWTPLIGLKNSAREPLDPNWDNEYKAMLMAQGMLGWPPSGSFQSSCDLNMFKFPFDTQVCNMDFGNLVHLSKMVDLIAHPNVVDLSFYMESREFEILDTSATSFVMQNELDDMFSVPIIRYTITIKRRPAYYMLNIIIPTMVLALLSAFTFYVPVDSGEKLSLSITILLSFSVFLLILSDNTPQTSGPLPFLAVYLTATICISTASMIAQMITLNMYHVVNPAPVPACLKAMARCLGGACRKRKSQTHPLEEGNPEADLESDYEEGKLPEKPHESKTDDVLRELQKITEFIDEKNAEAELKDDWQKVARSLDNVFFALFLIVQIFMIGLTLTSVFG